MLTTSVAYMKRAPGISIGRCGLSSFSLVNDNDKFNSLGDSTASGATGAGECSNPAASQIARDRTGRTRTIAQAAGIAPEPRKTHRFCAARAARCAGLSSSFGSSCICTWPRRHNCANDLVAPRRRFLGRMDGLSQNPRVRQGVAVDKLGKSAVTGLWRGTP